jgi:hypothetical protein
MNFEFVDGRWQMSQEYSPKLRALAAAAWDEGNIALARSRLVALRCLGLGC